MSIREFIEKGNVERRIGKTMPIPYMESIEVSDDKIDIQLAVYMHIPEHEWAHDEGKTFIDETVGGVEPIHTWVMLLIDRDSNTPAFASVQYDKDTGAIVDYTNMPPAGFTRVANGIDSPLRYIRYAQHTGEHKENFSIAAKFTMPSWSDENIMNGIVADLSTDSTIKDAFAEYKWSTMSTANLSGLTHITTSSTLTELEVYRQEIVPVLNQMIAENDVVIPHIMQKSYCTAAGASAAYYALGDNTFYGGMLQDYTMSDYDLIVGGGAYVKLNNTVTINMLESFFDTGFTNPISAKWFNLTDTTGALKVGFVSFSMTGKDYPGVDLNEEISEKYDENSGVVNLWEAALSEINYCTVMENDEMVFEPTTIFIDKNGSLHPQAMQTLDGLYYANADITRDDIVNSMNSISTTGAPFSSISAFKSVLATYSTSFKLLPELNKFRKSYPEKSSATPAGQFYESFAEILFNSNKIVKRGTPVRKALVNNPILKDLRGVVYTGITGEVERTDWMSPFSIKENGLWSRYTEVVDRQNDETIFGGSDTSEEHKYDDIYRGGQFDYNFIDHAFLFFNYEQVMKRYTELSYYLYVPYFERYFSQDVTNASLSMRAAIVSAYWWDRPSDTFSTAYADPGDSTLVLAGAVEATPIAKGVSTDFNKTSPFLWMYNNYQGINNVVDEAYQRDRFTLRVQNSSYDETSIVVSESDVDQEMYEGGTIKNVVSSYDVVGAGTEDRTRIQNEYGGADFMHNEYEYSFLTMRGFSPITIREGERPLHMEYDFNGNPINYRLACLEYQKCNLYDGNLASEGNVAFNVSDSGFSSIIDEENEHMFFRASMIVKDETYQIFLSLYRSLQLAVEAFQDYYDAAADACSYNETTGYFNQFFVNAVNERYPSLLDSPYYRASLLLHIYEDIFYKAYGGNPENAVASVKATLHNISPDSGTLTSVNNFKTRLEGLLEQLKELADVGKHYSGHGYGTLEDAIAGMLNKDDIGVWYTFGHLPFDGDGSGLSYDPPSPLTDLAPHTGPKCSTVDAATAVAFNPVFSQEGSATETYDNYPLYPSINYSFSESTYTAPDPDLVDPDAYWDLQQGLYDELKKWFEGNDVLMEGLVDMQTEVLDKLDLLTDSFTSVDVLDNFYNLLRDRYGPIWENPADGDYFLEWLAEGSNMMDFSDVLVNNLNPFMEGLVSEYPTATNWVANSWLADQSINMYNYNGMEAFDSYVGFSIDMGTYNAADTVINAGMMRFIF